MKIKQHIIFLILLSSIFSITNINFYFNQAGDFYKNRQYEDALTIYQELINQGITNHILFYNYANCNFKIYKKHHGEIEQEGYLGRAICYYYKALKYNPTDSDIANNLKYAKSFIVNQLDTSEIGSPLLNIIFFFHYNLNWKNQIFISSLLFLAAMLLFGLFFIWKNSLRFKLLNLGFIVTIVYLSFLISGIIRYQKVINNNEAIITKQVCEIKTEPTQESPLAFNLNEGNKVFVARQEGKWINIYISSGFSGWVNSDYILKI